MGKKSKNPRKKIIEENKNSMELCLNNLDQINKYNLYIEKNYTICGLIFKKLENFN